METTCKARAWPQQCWKSCLNGSNIVAPRFGDHGTKKKCWEFLAQKFDQFQTSCNNSQQHATACENGRNVQQPTIMLGVVGKLCCVRLPTGLYGCPLFWHKELLSHNNRTTIKGHNYARLWCPGNLKTKISNMKRKVYMKQIHPPKTLRTLSVVLVIQGTLERNFWCFLLWTDVSHLQKEFNRIFFLCS